VTLRKPSAPRFAAAIASIAGELSTPITVAALVANPAATNAVPVPTSTTLDEDVTCARSANASMMSEL